MMLLSFEACNVSSVAWQAGMGVDWGNSAGDVKMLLAIIRGSGQGYLMHVDLLRRTGGASPCRKSA